MEGIDRSALIEYFALRRNARDEAMRAYWAGRIDGHCLQNAIRLDELQALAYVRGFNIDWKSALALFDQGQPLEEVGTTTSLEHPS